MPLGRKVGLDSSGMSRGLPSYQVASWSSQTYGHNRYGPKMGGCAPLGNGELGPNLTQCDQGQDLPARQISSWSIQPFGHNTPMLQTDRTDRQWSHSTGQTVLQMVAPKPQTNDAKNRTFCSCTRVVKCQSCGNKFSAKTVFLGIQSKPNSIVICQQKKHQSQVHQEATSHWMSCCELITLVIAISALIFWWLNF